MTANGEAAREAIERLFGDTSVEKQVTLDDLEELQSDVAFVASPTTRASASLPVGVRKLAMNGDPVATYQLF